MAAPRQRPPHFFFLALEVPLSRERVLLRSHARLVRHTVLVKGRVKAQLTNPRAYRRHHVGYASWPHLQHEDMQ